MSQKLAAQVWSVLADSPPATAATLDNEH